VTYTKAQLLNAMYLLLDDTLKHIECEKVKKEGNWDCHRCDDCMFEQYLKKSKQGIMCRKTLKK
jgi:hypothetical protein